MVDVNGTTVFGGKLLITRGTGTFSATAINPASGVTVTTDNSVYTWFRVK